MGIYVAVLRIPLRISCDSVHSQQYKLRFLLPVHAQLQLNIRFATRRHLQSTIVSITFTFFLAITLTVALSFTFLCTEIRHDAGAHGEGIQQLNQLISQPFKQYLNKTSN